MAAMRGPRLQVGSSAWVAEERSCALQIAQSEVEEFSFSARNEVDWLNEHMAGIFDENETNIAETFKTPGKLRGKTPRTARKPNGSEARVPLSDVFTATPNGSTNRFNQKLSRVQSPKAQAKKAAFSPGPAAKGASRRQQVLSPKPAPKAAPVGGPSQDSGYGSQDIYSQTMPAVTDDMFASQQTFAEYTSPINTRTDFLDGTASDAQSPDKHSQIAQEDETMHVLDDEATKAASPHRKEVVSHDDDARDAEDDAMDADNKQSSPVQEATQVLATSDAPENYEDSPERIDGALDEVRSPSDASSPIRPLVRKSSLNFASLPAREPLTAGKSLGARGSRPSQLDHNRKSYYNQHSGGKSLGGPSRRDDSDEEDEGGDEDGEEQQIVQTSGDKTNPALNHNKTYTQRLQDQINMLGKSKPSGGRLSKSIHNLGAVQQQPAPAQSSELPKSPSPKSFEPPKTTPGAFPEDDDDWIDPPPTQTQEESRSSRPGLPKSHSADVMEGIHKSDHVGDADFGVTGSQETLPQAPPSSGPSHAKSASVPQVPKNLESQTHPLVKAATISNSSMYAVAEDGELQTPSKSPSRGFRDSPLKQVKNKLSSILKSSKGLLASSAALSAEGKTSLMSPSTARLGFYGAPSSESLASKAKLEAMSTVQSHSAGKDDNKTLPIAKRTRASNEREKEDKRREKDTKHIEEQMAKLEKARAKEADKARVFSKEQERLAALERQVAAKKEEEKVPVKETPKPTRSSPRKNQQPPPSTTKTIDRDIEMSDAPTIPPPSIHRPAAPSQAPKAKEIKRPMKPTREPQVKSKQAPTLIRVNMGSQHSQYHSTASNSTTNVTETMTMPTPQPASPSKASKATLQTKTSTQSLKGAASAARSKTEAAAKKKEQEEREAQRRREAKAEVERKRAATLEEQRKQEQRRQEAERQKQRDREQAAAHAEKQNAQRQAMIEKAKQTRAPPPAARSQPNGPPDHSYMSQDESSRPANTMLSNASKAGMKRTIGPDARTDAQGTRPASRGGPQYQSADAKRRRTGDDSGEPDPPNIKGPPVRPSAAFKKELPKKSLFQSSYANAQGGANGELFKATVTAQHNSHVKSGHPLDMAQISKGAIPFPPNANASGAAYKTPARAPMTHAGKSTTKPAQRSSPRFQNGESIELPEIDTDEDESEADSPGIVADWVNSPNLRQLLLQQETMDPSQIFGPPAPLNMEEVFSKNKERWHRFRARTSSANWSGTDRLTEEEIRKDLAARDKLRRDGGWSYEMGKDLN